MEIVHQISLLIVSNVAQQLNIMTYLLPLLILQQATNVILLWSISTSAISMLEV